MLHILFGWPNGICTGNLIASAIWTVPAMLHIDRRLRKLHRTVEKRDH